jgi:hypothetical protein
LARLNRAGRAVGIRHNHALTAGAPELETLELAKMSVSLAGIAVAMLGHGELSHIPADPTHDLFARRSGVRGIQECLSMLSSSSS